tara:strand:- start:232 stop:459 length:228 start_codon:yes stop_codon:yes gene_type:complete
MKTLTCYQTSDGVLHTNYTDANTHAKNRYETQISMMAHQLVKIEKYVDMMDKLDGFKGSMQMLLDLADDLVLDKE